MATRHTTRETRKTSRGNRLLAALPTDDRRRLSSSVETMALPDKRIIYKPGDPIKHVYFPGDGFFSVLVVLGNGDMVEVATVGTEGIVGASNGAMKNPETSLTMVQAGIANCYRMSAASFRREMDKRGAFHDIITRYNQAMMGVIMQGTACNVVHSVEQRLAKWLLMAHDRVAVDSFPLTQEFLAMMLGAARPTVTNVAGTLQRAGLITYRRGQLTVQDREALEDAACECYRVTSNLLARV